MKFGSVCSGIEAASVAWHPLGWTAAWLAEIEPFPSAVLKHHYPEVPNLGDMSKLPERIRSGEIEAPDIFCGGTPCQAFSVAGLRKSLDDARGNLSLTFCEIANEIDSVRSFLGEHPAIVFWENVPGVLNTKDNAFGCFLAGLAGEDDPLVPAGGKWTNAGCVFGPKRTVAWRVLDAQYFGVAQRRRRVFVVASARTGFDPVKVLFEFDGVRRDTAPSREKGQVAPISTPEGANGGSEGSVETFACGRIGAYASASASATLLKSGQDLGPGCETIITMAHGQGGAEIGFDRAPTLTCNHEAPISAYAIQAGALRTNPNSGPDGVGVQADHAYTLEARAEVQAVCVTGDINHTLKAEGFDASEDGTGRGTPMVPCVAPTLVSNGDAHSGYRDEHGLVAVAVALRGREGGATAELGDEVQNCLRASGGGGDKAHVLAMATREVAQTITSNYGKQCDNSDTALGPNVAIQAMQVRRLTPVECEALQGFPKNYTMIPWRKKHAADCPDGPRYKALGNSWAVPNVRWIGSRIAAHLREINIANDNKTQLQKTV